MITREQVRHIAKLARIELSEKELRKFQRELSSILDYFDILKKAKTGKAEPTFHIEKKIKIMREDMADSEDPKVVDKIIESAPDKKERYFKVKAILR